jgi:hypothetical protein
VYERLEHGHFLLQQAPPPAYFGPAD